MASVSDQRIRVLLADDHPINRAVVDIILDLIDADLVSVEDGAQAVAQFKAGAFDVVLMDLQMPNMDGLTAIREIRRFEAENGRAATPIVVVTANAFSEQVAASREAGADDLISKPIIPDVLLAAIEDLRRRGGDTSQALLTG
ncbi:MAG: response regulator [Caulobacterales bacterium]|jgi:CheY-like chemotaxis protein